ncbi:hypothetical protein Q9189_000384 [Teloschistes chrysophthalmus]
MAESVIKMVGLRLPLELRFEIYMLCFDVDIGELQRLIAERDHCRIFGIPSKAVLQQNERYRAHRRRVSSNPAEHRFPDYVEEAFLQDDRTVINQKQISSHAHSLNDFLPSSIQNRTGHTDLIFAISTAAQLQPFPFDDAIYDLLHDGTLDIDDSNLHQVDDISDLQLIIKSLNPTFRHAIKSIRLTYEPKRLSSVLQTLNSEQLPGLEVLYLRFCKGCTKDHTCTTRNRSFRHPGVAFPSLQAALGSHVRVEADPGDLQGFSGRKVSQCRGDRSKESSSIATRG